ncbi:MAG TPA: DUF4276 family protein [Stellaceae bacterium]|nr:DUF4276 family protein [Stellaceae bacterium]
MTLFIHVEEPSMEDALKALLPRLLAGREADIQIIDHGSKWKLLRNLPNRYAGYIRRCKTEDIRILVAVDRDDDDCRGLKAKLEELAINAGLPTKSAPGIDGRFRVVNRIVVEELEAWFFGDLPALRAAYPRVPETLARRQGFREPDAIKGGTWEKLLRVLQAAGYYPTVRYLPKSAVARKVAAMMDPQRNTSTSFRHFACGLEALLA